MRYDENVKEFESSKEEHAKPSLNKETCIYVHGKKNINVSWTFDNDFRKALFNINCGSYYSVIPLLYSNF